MSWIVLVRPEAERDLVEARDWYEQKRAALGAEFLDEVAAAMHILERERARERRLLPLDL